MDLLAKAGFNSIRLPMHYNLFTLPIEQEPVKGQNTWLTTGFDLVDNLLSWCKANRIYLILDLHASPGGQGKDANISDADPSKPSLWESELNRQKTIALWRKLAQRYANEPWIGGYDLLNEPNWTFEGKDKNGKAGFLEQTALGALPGHHPLNPGGGHEPHDHHRRQWLGQQLQRLPRPVGQQHGLQLPQILESEHAGSHRALPLPARKISICRSGWAKAGKTPTNGSANASPWSRGTISAGHGGRTKRWIRSCILTVKRPDEFKKCVDYWNKGGEPPSREIAAKGLFDLVENLKAANCRYNTNVARALSRPPLQPPPPRPEPRAESR